MSVSLLPPGSTAFETAADLAGAARIDGLPVAIAESTRPDTTPSAFLPFVAWGRSADIFGFNWREEKQRDFAGQVLDIHRVKGTLAAIEKSVAFVDGARIVSVTTPPAAFFAGCPYDEIDAEYRAWVGTLPELRIRPNDGALIGGGGTATKAEHGQRLPPECFLGAETDDEPTFFAGAPEPEPWVASIVDNDVETPVRVREIADPRRGRADDTIFEVSGSADAGLAVFADEAWDGCFLDGVADEPLYRQIGVDPVGRSSRNAVDALIGQGDAVQDVRPLTRAADGAFAPAVYADDALEGAFFDAGDDGRDIVFVWPLVTGLGRTFPGASALDHDRLGMPPYTAELVIEMSGEAGPDVFFADADPLDGGIAGPAYDDRALDALCDAVASAQALRDCVLIDLDANRRLFSEARAFADIRF